MLFAILSFMTPEERSLLQETHALAKENHETLLWLKRRARLSTGMKVAYWTVIIGISFGALYFIQPYIDFIKSLTGGSSSGIQNVGYTQQLQDLLK